MSQEAAAAATDSAGARGSRLESWCNRLAHAALPSDYELLDRADLVSGHPWAFLAEIALCDPGSVAYYRYLYGLTRSLAPERILEVGTAFGLSGAAFLQAAPGLRQMISLDLGVFSLQYDIVAEAAGAGWSVMQRYRNEELKADGRNIAFARERLGRLVAKLGSQAELLLFQVNTQPAGSDNFDAQVHVPPWRDVTDLVRELERAPVDLLFIDGKHTGDGLYQDFKSFFPYVRPGGLVICDDLHDASFSYDWAGQTLESFERVLEEFGPEIEESCVWSFPQVPDWLGQEPVIRPWGLVRKRGAAGEAPSVEDQKRLAADEIARLTEGPTLDRLRFLNEHKTLLQEVENLGLAEEAARRLQWAKEHPALFEFARKHPAVFEFVAQHEALLSELQLSGLADETAGWLDFVRRHPALFSELQLSGLADETAGWLNFALRHPALMRYLAAHPQVAADAERNRAHPATRVPNVELFVLLLGGWLSGRYRG